MPRLSTREFQRLRSIQQLSTCEYVFPAATHNRFSHSLGAYYLAKELTFSINEVQPNTISKDDAELVHLAALLHDIGHPLILIYLRLLKFLQHIIRTNIGVGFYLNPKIRKLGLHFEKLSEIRD